MRKPSIFSLEQVSISKISPLDLRSPCERKADRVWDPEEMEESKSIGHLNQEDKQTHEFIGTVATYTGPMSIHPSGVLALKGNLDINSHL